MRLLEFDYNLPRELIAQAPLTKRDSSRLLILNRKDKSFQESIFKEITGFFDAGDILVLNNTKVLPARLFACRESGGKAEVLLLNEQSAGIWEALVKPGRKIRPQDKLLFTQAGFAAEVLEKTASGTRLLKFKPARIKKLLYDHGAIPLPHYIKTIPKNPGRYQTVYAKKYGAVAAPTAGLHFTRQLLERLACRGIKITYITLHCGLATFRPVKAEDIRNHPMPAESFEIGARAAGIINKAKAARKRIFAAGTTVARALEAAAEKNSKGFYGISPKNGLTSLYIYPGHKFRVVDALLTNFHLPKSTNLILVSAFAGRGFIRSAYQYAIKRDFRFYSFGDAMLVV